MRAEIELTQTELREILDSLHSVASGEEDISMDLNLVADPEQGVHIYVRNHTYLQVLHKITESSRFKISEYSEFVFNSKTLHDLVKDADSESISLRFYDHHFEMMVGDNYFTTPTTFELNLVKESEFQDYVSVNGLINIDSIDREGLLDTLSMMNNISPVANISISEKELWISVSDIVQGDGKVMKRISDDVPNMEFRYTIRPLRDFLRRMNADSVDLYIGESGTLKIEVLSGGRTSHLLLSQRMED